MMMLVIIVKGWPVWPDDICPADAYMLVIIVGIGVKP